MRAMGLRMGRQPERSGQEARRKSKNKPMLPSGASWGRLQNHEKWGPGEVRRLLSSVPRAEPRAGVGSWPTPRVVTRWPPGRRRPRAPTVASHYTFWVSGKLGSGNETEEWPRTDQRARHRKNAAAAHPSAGGREGGGGQAGQGSLAGQQGYTARRGAPLEEVLHWGTQACHSVSDASQ